MDSEDLDILLWEVQAAQKSRESDRSRRLDVWNKMHDLAEAQYAPALDFFVSCLQDPDWEWRLSALRCIGFHYPIPPESSITKQIRNMLLTDPGGDGEVRMSAASVLGSRSRWPDAALKTALHSDPDDLVRSAAFGALLELAGVPFPVQLQEEGRARAGEIHPTWEDVERVLAEVGIGPKGLSTSNIPAG